VVAGAKVEVANPVSGFKRELVTDSDGNFRLTNVPFNPYHMNVIMGGHTSRSARGLTHYIHRNHVIAHTGHARERERSVVYLSTHTEWSWNAILTFYIGRRTW